MDMDKRKIAYQGMVVTPHHLATQSAVAILREGGTAMEATIAAAATLAVVYPHMNGIGGDSFWLIVPPQGEPVVIEAAGTTGSLATLGFYSGLQNMPIRGPKAANTVAGTVGGWQEALNYVSECGYQKMSTSRLLSDAIKYSDDGFPVSSSLEANIKESVDQGFVSQEFKRVFLPEGRVPKVGEKLVQKELAKTLKRLVNDGLDSFYRGELSKMIAEDIESVGMPLTLSDLENYCTLRKDALKLSHSHGELYNTPAPTQGVASLSILGILDKLNIDGRNEGEWIHTAVEATKQAFNMCHQSITDPNYMKVNTQSLITDREISKMAENVNFNRASIGKGRGDADTIWLGVMDNKGFSVSFIQSTYYWFGSGVILPKTGILWHNRGVLFTLDEDKLSSIKPHKKPFHTLNPAAARLNDGRIIVYGTRGGDGQPQTQAAIFHRYVVQGLPLQTSVSAPRWLYGNVYRIVDETLKLENRFSDSTVKYLKERGYNVVMVTAFDDVMGHAGMLVRHPNGMLEGAFDPRSDGSAAGF